METDFLRETAKEYIEKYKIRLNEFLNEYEADQQDFIEREIEYFESTMNDIENAEASSDGYSTTGYTNFSMASALVLEIGWKKIYYSTKSKIKYLESRIEIDTFESKSKKTTSEEINIFHRKMKLDIPRSHFRRLTTNKSKNGEPFLTKIQLDNFIQKAFLGEKLPKQRINVAPKGEKILIQYVFKEFYNQYYDYFNTCQVSKLFIELLTENFDNWEYENVKNSFNKIPKKPLQLLN